MNKKNKILIIVLLICIALIGGGTLAYFNSRHTNVTSLSTDIYQTSVTDSFTSPENFLPGTVVEHNMKFQNTGNVKVAVRATVEQYWITANGNRISNYVDWPVIPNAYKGNDGSLSMGMWDRLGTTYNVSFNNLTQNYETVSETYYYPFFVDADEETEPLFTSIYFRDEIENDMNCTSENGVSTCTSTGDGYDGATYHLNVTFEAVQADAYSEYWIALENNREHSPYTLGSNMDVLTTLNIMDKPYMDTITYTYTDNNWQRGQTKNLGNVNYTNDTNMPLIVTAKVKESWIDSNGHEIKQEYQPDYRIINEGRDSEESYVNYWYPSRDSSDEGQQIEQPTNTILDLDKDTIYDSETEYYSVEKYGYDNARYAFNMGKLLATGTSIDRVFSTVTFKNNIPEKYNNTTYKLEIEYTMIDAAYCNYSDVPWCQDRQEVIPVYENGIYTNGNTKMARRLSFSYEWRNRTTNEVVSGPSVVPVLRRGFIKENNYYYYDSYLPENEMINEDRFTILIDQKAPIWPDFYLKNQDWYHDAQVDLDNKTAVVELLVNDDPYNGSILQDKKLVLTIRYEFTPLETYRDDWNTKVNILQPSE